MKGFVSSSFDLTVSDEKFRYIGLKEGKTSIRICVINSSWERVKSIILNVTVIGPDPTSMMLQKQLHMQVGTTHSLAPIFYPEGKTSAVSWFSSDSTVVAVNDGKLTAKAMGEATITCIAACGLREECHVVVTPVLAASIKLNKDRIKLSAGDNFQFASEITPDENTVKKVAWSSLNPNIVTIDKDGKATCVANGWTVVVARTIDGSDLTAGCIVQVGNGLDGDINFDGMIDVDDVNQLINIILKLT